MSEITLNGGAAVLRAHVFLPLAGVWSADLDVDTDEDVAGAVTVEVDGAVAFRGTVVDGGVTHGLWRGRIVGGAAGLRGTLPALAYLDATRADVVRDALAEAGETLSATSDSLAAAVARFHRAEGAAARAIDDPRTAALEPVQLVKDLVNPSFLAMNRAGDRLYTVHGDLSDISADNGDDVLVNEIEIGRAHV